MSIRSPATGSMTEIERAIVADLAAIGVRLRFDRVVLRLVGGLQRTLEGEVPAGEALVFTVTAPIRQPARTAAGIETLVRGGLLGGDGVLAINGNEVRLKLVPRASPDMPPVLGFVHNPDADGGRILAVVEDRLGGTAR